MADKSFDRMLQGLNILIVDGNHYMRRLTRTMLMNLGAKSVIEASDGLAALEQIRNCDPDVMLMEWDMPVLNGMEVMHIVRSPGVFPRPNLPIIMLTNRTHRSSVIQALRAGVHEFLIKPTSPKALRDRLTAIAVKPRPMIKIGKFYVPQPRRVPAAMKSPGSVERIQLLGSRRAGPVVGENRLPFFRSQSKHRRPASGNGPSGRGCGQSVPHTRFCGLAATSAS